MSTLELAEMEKRLRESDLKALEDYRKGLADAPVLYKAEGFLRATQEPAGSALPMTFVASEESEDRMGDIITLAGWDTEHFKRNPVFMFIHQLDVAPIGTVPKTWTEEKQLLATVKWDDADPLGAFIKGKYERGVMRAVSVGFRPLEFEERKEEGKKGMGRGIHFKKQELLEISAVPVPAHPKALQRALATKKFSIIVPETLSITETHKAGQIGLLPLLQTVSRGNRDKLTQAATLLQEVLATAQPAPAAPEGPKANPTPTASVDWEAIRKGIANLKEA